MFVFKYSFKKQNEIINGENPNIRCFAQCKRSLFEALEGVVEDDWIYGEVYDKDELIGTINYYGVGTFIINNQKIINDKDYYDMMRATSKDEIIKIYNKRESV